MAAQAQNKSESVHRIYAHVDCGKYPIVQNIKRNHFNDLKSYIEKNDSKKSKSYYIDFVDSPKHEITLEGVDSSPKIIVHGYNQQILKHCCGMIQEYCITLSTNPPISSNEIINSMNHKGSISSKYRFKRKVCFEIIRTYLDDQGTYDSLCSSYIESEKEKKTYRSEKRYHPLITVYQQKFRSICNDINFNRLIELFESKTHDEWNEHFKSFSAKKYNNPRVHFYKKTEDFPSMSKTPASPGAAEQKSDDTVDETPGNPGAAEQKSDDTVDETSGNQGAAEQKSDDTVDETSGNTGTENKKINYSENSAFSQTSPSDQSNEFEYTDNGAQNFPMANSHNFNSMQYPGMQHPSMQYLPMHPSGMPYQPMQQKQHVSTSNETNVKVVTVLNLILSKIDDKTSIDSIREYIENTKSVYEIEIES